MKLKTDFSELYKNVATMGVQDMQEYLCPYKGETDHAREVLVVADGRCEFGRECLVKCPYSF